MFIHFYYMHITVIKCYNHIWSDDLIHEAQPRWADHGVPDAVPRGECESQRTLQSEAGPVGFRAWLILGATVNFHAFCALKATS